MNRMSLPLALRAGFLLICTGLLVALWEAESTAGVPVDVADPDQVWSAPGAFCRISTNCQVRQAARRKTLRPISLTPPA